MFFLSPAKLLVVLVIVMIVVGPDRLPQIARQIGAALQSLRQMTEKVEGDLREAVPNLPSSRDLAHYTRRPTALLTKLMDLDDDAPGAASADEHLVADPGAAAVIDTGPPLEADWPADHAAAQWDPAESGEPHAPAASGANGARNGAPNGARPRVSRPPVSQPPVSSTADGTPYSDPNMN